MAMALGGLGLVGSLVGSIGQGIAQQNASNYQAQVARNNAVIANNDANYAALAGQDQAQQKSLQGASTFGKLKASQAANGVDVNSGSAVDVQATQRMQNQLDTANTLNNAELQGYGYRVQAINDTAQAQLYQSQANEAVPGAILGATGGLLSGASGLAFKWSQLGNSGTGGGNPLGGIFGVGS